MFTPVVFVDIQDVAVCKNELFCLHLNGKVSHLSLLSVERCVERLIRRGLWNLAARTCCLFQNSVIASRVSQSAYMFIWVVKINLACRIMLHSCLYLLVCRGLHRWLRGKESVCQCRRCEFDPWVGKSPWSRAWQPTPVFLPGKFHGQRSLAG